MRSKKKIFFILIIAVIIMLASLFARNGFLSNIDDEYAMEKDIMLNRFYLAMDDLIEKPDVIYELIHDREFLSESEYAYIFVCV